ncbi:hypothetical protein Q7P37_007117 [Cladosporium fusiforme]
MHCLTGTGGVSSLCLNEAAVNDPKRGVTRKHVTFTNLTSLHTAELAAHLTLWWGFKTRSHFGNRITTTIANHPPRTTHYTPISSHISKTMSSNCRTNEENPTTVSDAATEINWEDITWNATCEQCNAEYDALESGHIYLCGVCMILFPDEILPFQGPEAEIATTTATAFASETPHQSSASSDQLCQTLSSSSSFPKPTPTPTTTTISASQMQRQVSACSHQSTQTASSLYPVPKPTPAIATPVTAPPATLTSDMPQQSGAFSQPHQTTSLPSPCPKTTPAPTAVATFTSGMPNQLSANSNLPRSLPSSPSPFPKHTPASATATAFASEMSRQLNALSKKARQTPSPPLVSTKPTVASPTPESAAPTKDKKPKAPLPDIKCTRCARTFKQNRNNNGVECTRCCNKYAALGYNLFAREGIKAPSKVVKVIEEYYNKEKNQNQLEGTAMTPSPSATAPVTNTLGSASTATISPATPTMNNLLPLPDSSGSRKRANTEMNESDQSGAYEHVGKRSRLEDDGGWSSLATMPGMHDSQMQLPSSAFVQRASSNMDGGDQVETYDQAAKRARLDMDVGNWLGWTADETCNWT